MRAFMAHKTSESVNVRLINIYFVVNLENCVYNEIQLTNAVLPYKCCAASFTEHLLITNGNLKKSLHFDNKLPIFPPLRYNHYIFVN